ncbi:unnamed protein product [Spodoptera littoralis]|uniref:Uncharacterized protein n=1 Tax=Spodoptera littoralis TaxID=7109 RepID=A0A9P0I9C2_SPOLI|nr:unnamed protein product [Spodoptera littoralis]CAH1642608.1 unnamed protein product [Spodoptera littoralis]
MLLLLIIALSCLSLCEVKAKEVNKSVILNMHHKNFREIKTILKKVNEKLQDIGQLMKANKEVATLPVFAPPALRDGMKEKQNKNVSSDLSSPNKTKPNSLGNRENSSTTSPSLTTSPNITSTFHASSAKLKQNKLSENIGRSDRETTSPTVVSTVKNNSTISHITLLAKTTASHLAQTTAKSSVPVLRDDNHELVSDPGASLESQSRAELLENYYRLLEEYNEGYLVVFLMELSRLVAVKDVEDVHIILRHMEPILHEMLKSKKLGWFGHPTTHVMIQFGLFVSDGPIQLVRNYSGMVYHMMRLRNTSLDSDVNSIIDYADILYEDAEGRLLFEALRDFEAYPDVSKTSTEVCQGLVDSFFAPYRRLLKSERRQNLLDAINYLLKTRFPRRKSNDDDIIPFIMNGPNHIFEHHNHKYGSKVDAKIASLRSSKNKYPTSEDYLLTRTRERQSKHRINLKKKTTEDIRKTTKEKDIQGLTLSSYLQTSSLKPRFKKVYEKYHETEKTRSSFNSGELIENKVVRSGRNNEMEETHGQSFLKQVRAHLSKSNLFRTNDNKMKVKQKILKEIVEGSSYSDEEESLQKNLIKALQNYNKGRHHKYVGTTMSQVTPGTISSRKQYLNLTKQSGVKFKKFISLVRGGFLR